MPLNAPPSTAGGQPLPPIGHVPLATLDATAAIALMDDSHELYQEIARAYLQELVDLGPRLDSLLGQPNLTEATRTLHTFKGLSLTVGANLLSEVCRQCELQLKAQQPNQGLDHTTRASMKDALERAIAQTHAALLAELASPEPASPLLPKPATGATDTAALLTDLRTLRAVLARSDMQALDLSAGVWERHPARHGALQTLHQAVKIFNFSQAVVQCDELIKTFSTITR